MTLAIASTKAEQVMVEIIYAVIGKKNEYLA